MTISPVTSADGAEIDQIVERLEDLARQQNAGFPIGVDEVTPLEFELLKFWHSTVAGYERRDRARIAAVIEAIITR